MQFKLELNIVSHPVTEIPTYKHIIIFCLAITSEVVHSYIVWPSC